MHLQFPHSMQLDIVPIALSQDANMTKQYPGLGESFLLQLLREYLIPCNISYNYPPRTKKWTIVTSRFESFS